MTAIKLPTALDLTDREAEELGLILYQRDYGTEALDFINNTARNLHYWATGTNILPPQEGEGKRRKYSFIALVWLGIVNELRSLGMEKEPISNLKDVLFQVEDYEAINEELSKYRKESEKLLAQHWGISVTEVQQVLDQFVEKQEAIKKLKLTKLYHYIVYCFTVKTPFHLLVNKDGGHYAFPQKDFKIHLENPEFLQFFNQTHISVSLSEIIISFLAKPTIKDELKQHFFTQKEWALIELIRKEKPEAITIIDAKGGEELIEVTQKVYVTLEQRLSEIITKGGYETIVIQTQNGKPVHCKRVKKVKS